MSNKKSLIQLISGIAILMIALSLALFVPSGKIPEEKLEQIMNEKEESAFSLFSVARADEKEPEPLNIDFSGGKKPKAELFKEDGFEDESIKLKLETREENGLVLRIAYVQIKHPSQLRTQLAGSPKNLGYGLISDMAKKVNAILALNGDNMKNDKGKTTFEYRMGVKIRDRYPKKPDLLVIDENSDFNLFIGDKKQAELEAFLKEGHKIINAFTFGPALVKDGQMLTIPDKYMYNPNGKEPRIAIGQIDKLSYVVLLVEGRSKSSSGATMQELASIMHSLGAKQAYNLDGGNSATLVYNDGYYQKRSKTNERAQSDFIYFASLIGE